MTDYVPTPEDELWLAMCSALHAVEYAAQELQHRAHGMTTQDVQAWAAGLEQCAARTLAAMQNVAASKSVLNVNGMKNVH